MVHSGKSLESLGDGNAKFMKNGFGINSWKNGSAKFMGRFAAYPLNLLPKANANGDFLFWAERKEFNYLFMREQMTREKEGPKVGEVLGRRIWMSVN
jgi:hypothetical protein